MPSRGMEKTRWSLSRWEQLAQSTTSDLLLCHALCCFVLAVDVSWIFQIDVQLFEASISAAVNVVHVVCGLSIAVDVCVFVTLKQHRPQERGRKVAANGKTAPQNPRGNSDESTTHEVRGRTAAPPQRTRGRIMKIMILLFPLWVSHDGMHGKRAVANSETLKPGWNSEAEFPMFTSQIYNYFKELKKMIAISTFSQKKHNYNFDDNSKTQNDIVQRQFALIIVNTSICTIWKTKENDYYINVSCVLPFFLFFCFLSLVSLVSIWIQRRSQWQWQWSLVQSALWTPFRLARIMQKEYSCASLSRHLAWSEPVSAARNSSVNDSRKRVSLELCCLFTLYWRCSTDSRTNISVSLSLFFFLSLCFSVSNNLDCIIIHSRS